MAEVAPKNRGPMPAVDPAAGAGRRARSSAGEASRNGVGDGSSDDGSASDPRLHEIEHEVPRLRRYARYLTRDADRADDLVQECLLRAIARFESWQPGTNLRAWLFVILRNVFISELRRAGRAPTDAAVGDEHPGLAVSGRQETRLEVLELQRALDMLSSEHREVLLLVAVEGLKYEEAAEVLALPVGTVRSRLSRARMALRELLEGTVPDRVTGAP